MAIEAPALEEALAEAAKRFKAHAEISKGGNRPPYLLWEAIEEVIAEETARGVNVVELLLRWVRESDVTAEELLRSTALSSAMPDSADEFLSSLAADILEVVGYRDPIIADEDSLRIEADSSGR